MRPLRHLGELDRVAEQDDVPRRSSHRQRVRERDLPRLVDEQVVDGAVQLGPCEQPRRAGEQPHLGIGEGRDVTRSSRSERR